MHRILGVDPGLEITGYGVLEPAAGGPRLVEAGVVRGGTSSVPLAERLARFTRVSATRSPRSSRRRWHWNNSIRTSPIRRTSILMGHARGVICLAAAQAGIPVISYQRHADQAAS